MKLVKIHQCQDGDKTVTDAVRNFRGLRAESTNQGESR